MYEAVWGNGNTGVVAGTIGTFGSREQADRAVIAFLDQHGDNPAVGAWVRRIDGHDPTRCKHQWERSGGCQENPGTFDDGNGGMVQVDECRTCGLTRKRGQDYTGCRPGNTFGPHYYTRDGRRCTSQGRVLA